MEETKKSGFGTASLVLGIIGIVLSFIPIINNIAFILGVLAFIFAIVSLSKKASKGMAITGLILAIFACLITYAMQSAIADVFNGNGTVENSTEEAIYNLGDTITVKNSSGDEYTLQITNIKETKSRNQYSDKKPVQVFIVDYTYSCKSSKDNIYVSDMNFKIIDEKGEIGESYPDSSIKDSQSITAGTTCKAQMAFGVYNNSKKLKLQFFDNMFNGTPTAVYEIEL